MSHLISHLAKKKTNKQPNSNMKIGWLVPEIQAAEGLQNNRKQKKLVLLIGHIS